MHSRPIHINVNNKYFITNMSQKKTIKSMIQRGCTMTILIFYTWVTLLLIRNFVPCTGEILAGYL